MLMIKQLMTEIKFTRKSVRLIFLILLGCMAGGVFIHSLIACLISMFLFMFFFLKYRIKQDMPEVTCFLPMDLQERHNYVRTKGYLMAAAMGLLLIISLLVILWADRVPMHKPFMDWSAFLGIVLAGTDCFFMLSEGFVESENARYRKMERALYRQFCCPLWYRILNCFSRMVQYLAMLVCIYFGLWYDSHFENYDFAWKWKLVVGILILFLLITHIITMRYLVSTVEMGDFNAKRSDSDNSDNGLEI